MDNYLVFHIALYNLLNIITTEEGDLSFVKGDVISLVHELDENWMEGVFRGKRGSMPKNFLEVGLTPTEERIPFWQHRFNLLFLVFVFAL